MTHELTIDGIPVTLHHRGTLSVDALMSRPRLAIVGARAATAYGTQVAAEVAQQAVAAGYVVISGGAYGIDGAAHRGALAAGGPTVAVVATGVDVAYPSGHDRLFAQIVEQGAVLSEYPDGSAPTSARFLERNRIVALLSDAVILVEAAMRSGSLNTVRHATELGRPVYVVPGPITSPQSTGCHQAIRNGARLLTSIQDLAADMPHLPRDNELASHEAFVAEVRAALESDQVKEAVRVVFSTTEWDNGYFFATDATAHFPDGTTEGLSLDSLESSLTDVGSEFGSLGASAELMVDLLAGTVEVDTYGFS